MTRLDDLPEGALFKTALTHRHGVVLLHSAVPGREGTEVVLDGMGGGDFQTTLSSAVMVNQRVPAFSGLSLEKLLP